MNLFPKKPGERIALAGSPAMGAAMLFPKIGYRKKNSFFNPFFGSALALLIFQLPVYATVGVKLTWTASSGSKIAGHKIYYGTSSRNYSKVVTVGPAATSVTISGLTEGATYYFAATDFDSAGNQSVYSGEFVYVAGAATLASRPFRPEISSVSMLPVSPVPEIHRSDQHQSARLDFDQDQYRPLSIYRHQFCCLPPAFFTGLPCAQKLSSHGIAHDCELPFKGRHVR